MMNNSNEQQSIALEAANTKDRRKSQISVQAPNGNDNRDFILRGCILAYSCVHNFFIEIRDKRIRCICIVALCKKDRDGLLDAIFTLQFLVL